MKNIFTFFGILLSCTFLLQAQQTSFETAEGYTAGEVVHGISGWKETSDTSQYFYVTDEKSSDGDN